MASPSNAYRTLRQSTYAMIAKPCQPRILDDLTVPELGIDFPAIHVQVSFIESITK